jgi:hypothetical protein
MVTAVPKKDEAIQIRFGLGLNSRASEDEIDPRECSAGQNFTLDLENREFRNRPPFDLIATTPNAGSVDGFAQLLKADGTISTLVQSGTNVYQWDGGSGFTLVGTVVTGTKMRGPLSANWTLTDKVLISDIAQVNPLSEWDGSTFKHVDHNLSGAFIAKYAYVITERAFYANVSSNGTLTPHLLAGSKVSDYTNISVSDQPSSALGVDDPFYLLTPDLKPINGILSAFAETVFSSKRGRLFILTGTDSTNFSVAELFPDSAASGDESLVFAGNDIVYGRQGRIEAVSSTQNFGDVESSDLSRMIAGDVEGFDNWTSVANLRLQRLYFFPDGEQQCLMLQKSLRDQEVSFATGRALQGQAPKSPWSKFVTAHPFAFTPNAVMNMYDQIDGLEYVFMGDAIGNIYRMEGAGTDGDGGTTDVTVSRTSQMFSLPLNAEAFNVEGYLKYRYNEAFTATLTLLWAGTAVWNEVVTINAPTISGRPVYSGGFYYSNGTYYSTAFGDRFVREPFGIAGKSNEFQLKIDVTGKNSFSIAEVGIRFEAAS